MKALLLFGSILISASLFSQDNFPKHQIVGYWIDNQYSVFYPLGWSENGDFAYIFQDVNGMGGAYIYHFHFYIQSPDKEEPVYYKYIEYDLEMDTTYHHYEDSLYDENDSTYYITAWMKHVLWPEHQKEINKKLREFKINRSDNIKVQNLEDLKDDGVNLEIEKVVDTVEARRIDRELRLYYRKNGESKLIYELITDLNENGLVMSDRGYELELFFYKVEGIIKSPVKGLYYLYVHQFTMGYEEFAEKLLMISLKMD